MEKVIRVYYDVESTGLNEYKHSIHQIAGIIDINDEIVDEFDYKVKPHPKALIEDAALATCKVTKEQIMGYPDMKIVHKELTNQLGEYIDKFNPKEKAWLIGFNNRFFDDRFITAWFKQTGDQFIASWFYWGLDAQALSAQYLMNRRVNMPSFKLPRVAKELGLVVEEDKLHDAKYDVSLTREIYRIVTGLTLEI